MNCLENTGLQLARKVKNIGLNLSNINVDDLMDIVEKLDMEIRRFLKSKLPPRVEYDIVISIEKKDVVTITIDIHILGGYGDLVDYDSIVNDAVNYARRLFEEYLRKYTDNSVTQ